MVVRIGQEKQNPLETQKIMARKFHAFSLIETAIVLIIIGLVGGIALPTLKWAVEWQKETITAHHQEKILYALASYAVQNKMLPYAASPEMRSGRQEEGHRRGIVPYADLGLPESVARDGYRHWFTYLVDDHYAIAAQPGASQSGIKRLCLKVRHPNPLRVKGMQGQIAIALISHGPQGRGAYPNPMAAPPQGEEEMQNATSHTEIVDRPISHNPLNPFSHKVAWATAQNLLAFYAHAPCPPVEIDIESRGNKFTPADRATISGKSSGNRFMVPEKK